MSPRQTSGAIVCPTCGRLVDVSESKCPYCGRARPGLFGFVGVMQRLGGDLGFSAIVIGGCIVIYGLTLLFDQQGIRSGGLLGFLSPSMQSVLVFGASGSYPMFGLGRWWTPLSAGWLHGGLIHIFFNMMSLRNLAPPLAQLYGPSRMVILFNLSSILGFLLSSVMGWVHLPIPGLRGGQVTLGASAGICGLLGALIYYGRRTGNTYIRSQTWNWVLPLIAFGFLLPNIDNWAHIGGFLGGFLGGKWLDPLREERADHTVAALALLLASLGAVVASFLVPFASPF